MPREPRPTTPTRTRSSGLHRKPSIGAPLQPAASAALSPFATEQAAPASNVFLRKSLLPFICILRVDLRTLIFQLGRIISNSMETDKMPLMRRESCTIKCVKSERQGFEVESRGKKGAPKGLSPRVPPWFPKGLSPSDTSSPKPKCLKIVSRQIAPAEALSEGLSPHSTARIPSEGSVPPSPIARPPNRESRGAPSDTCNHRAILVDCACFLQAYCVLERKRGKMIATNIPVLTVNFDV